MGNRASLLNVTVDLINKKLRWTASFFGIIILVYVVKIVASLFIEQKASSFFPFAYVAAHIYMFVIGILAVNLISYLVSNGITRKNFFWGTTLVGTGLAIIIPLLVALLAFIEQQIIKIVDLPLLFDGNNLNIIESTSNLVGDFIQVVVVPPFIDPADNFYGALLLFSLNIFINFIAGTVIGVAFYRPHVTVRIAAIIGALLIIFMSNNLLRDYLNLPNSGLFDFLTMPMPFSLLINSLLIIIPLIIVRQLTKNISIKL